MSMKTKYQKLRYYPELITVILFFGVMMLSPISEQYLNKYYMEKRGLVYHEGHSKQGSSCPKPSNHSGNRSNLLHEVQADVSRFLGRQSFFLSLPPIIAVLYFGPLSDRYGRKPFFILNILGYFLFCLSLVLIDGFSANILFFHAGAFMVGLCGYLSGTITVVSSYLADVSTFETFPLRIAIIDCITFISLAISNMISGLVLRAFGFFGTFIFITTLSGIALFLSIFFLKESLDPEKRERTEAHWMKGPKKIFTLLMRPRSQKWRMRLLIPTDATLNLFGQVVIGPILLLRLLNIPFCWDATQIGYIRGTYFLLTGIGAVFSVAIIPMCFRKSVLIMISVASACGYLLTMGFSETKTMYYAATVIGTLSFAAPAMTKSILGSYVNVDEKGALYAFLGSLGSVLTLIGTYVYQALYRLADKQGNPSAIFVVMSFMTSVPFILALFYTLKEIRFDRKQRKKSKEEVIDEGVGEAKPLLS